MSEKELISPNWMFIAICKYVPPCRVTMQIKQKLNLPVLLFLYAFYYLLDNANLWKKLKVMAIEFSIQV